MDTVNVAEIREGTNVTSFVSAPYNSTALMLELNIWILVWRLNTLELQTFFNWMNASLALLILVFTSDSVPPCLSTTLPRSMIMGSSLFPYIASMILLFHLVPLIESAVNLAYKKNTTQSSIYDSVHSSSNAVDEKNHNCAFYGYTNTQDGTYEWWQVDLGAVYEIKAVQVINRKDYLNRLDGYAINITKSLNPLDTWQCYKDTENGWPTRLRYLHFCSALGRYITVSRERSTPDSKGDKAIINLCEVQVYGCPQGRYGWGHCNYNCSFGCLDTRCDPDYGYCYCNMSWRWGINGKFLMNIAKGKSATQSSNQNSDWVADKAVDGFTNRNGIDREVGCNCCSHTLHRQRTAWWQVDLKVPNTQRFAGFSLYLSNIAGRREWLCYKDNGPNLPDPIQHIYCPHTARYVYIYNERLPGHQYPGDYSDDAVLEICEVEVYGCPLFKYNNTCYEKCSIGAPQGCEPNTGNCTFGCKEGFTGLLCDACKVGRYGELCEKNCSVGCGGSSCNRITGKFDNGCTVNNNVGIQSKDCNAGKYGEQCNLNCSKNCFNSTCQQYTGNCNFGCNANWNGSKCQECVDGYYGDTCTPCPRGCSNDLCRKDDGYCTEGCKNALFGDFCNQSCPENCQQNRCDDRTGDCSDGCRTGNFSGSRCNVCVVGFYGKECDTACPENCKHTMCDEIDGTCMFGCKHANMTGNMCKGFQTTAKISDTATNVYIGLSFVGVISLIITVVIVITLILYYKRRQPRETECEIQDVMGLQGLPQTATKKPGIINS